MNSLEKGLSIKISVKKWLIICSIIISTPVIVNATEVYYGASNVSNPEQIQHAVARQIIESKTGSLQSFTAKLQEQLKQVNRKGVVTVPAGCYMIDGTLKIPAGITLLGAGIDKTIFYRNKARHKNSKSPMLLIRGNGIKGKTRISGISFVGNTTDSDAGWDKAIELRNVVNFRIDNCYFRRFGFAAIAVRKESSGVIDHSIFYSIYKPAIKNVGYGVVVFRGNNWVDMEKLSTNKAVFIEDCIFMGCRHAIAANSGAHYVFRYNTIIKNVVASSIDAHGRGFGSKRGTRCVEIYNNLLKNPIVPSKTGIRLRGGKGVVFNNKLIGYDIPIQLVIERGTPQNMKMRYPAVDQIHDLWLWNNKSFKGGTIAPSLPKSNHGFIKRNRDFFLKIKPGYKPYSYPHPLVRLQD